MHNVVIALQLLNIYGILFVTQHFSVNCSMYVKVIITFWGRHVGFVSQNILKCLTNKMVFVQNDI